MLCLATVNSAVLTTPVPVQTLEIPDDAVTDKACCTSAYPWESVLRSDLDQSRKACCAAVNNGALATIPSSQLTRRGRQCYSLARHCCHLIVHNYNDCLTSRASMYSSQRHDC